MTARSRTGRKKRPSPPPDRAKKRSATATPQGPSKSPVSGGRLWLFRTLAVICAPVVFVAVLEAGLRLAGYGYVTRAIVRYRSDDFDKYCDNIRFSWRFFPRSIAREFEPFTFETSKGKKTCRIFVAGASAAQGIPDGSYSFARMLGIMLAGRYPDIDFEVTHEPASSLPTSRRGCLPGSGRSGRGAAWRCSWKNGSGPRTTGLTRSMHTSSRTSSTSAAPPARRVPKSSSVPSGST